MRTVFGVRLNVLVAWLLITTIALADWYVPIDVAFGFLYLLPMAILGTMWSRWPLVIVGALCTALENQFDPYTFPLEVAVAHDIVTFSGLAGAGLIAYTVTRSRRLAAEADEQFEFFIKTSPAAIVTMTDSGEILLANAAAHRLFLAPPEALPGRNIRAHVPDLVRIASRPGSATRGIQSAMQCRASRSNGEAFLGEMFFSTYNTAQGPRVAAVIIDVSAAVQERELSGLDQLLASSRILVGAISHEMRNLCTAMAVNYETLRRSAPLAGNRDFETLGTLLNTLEQVGSAEFTLGTPADEGLPVVLAEILEELRLVLDPYCQQAGIDVHWEIPANLPSVWTDKHRLLQVLLNLLRNSERALAACDIKRIDVTATHRTNVVAIRVTDSGPGLPMPSHLFEPFQPGAEATGLGLYLSRALARSFRGDLRHEAGASGCTFVIDLQVVEEQKEPDRRALERDT